MSTGNERVSPLTQAQKQQAQPTSSGENSPAWSSSPHTETSTDDKIKELQEKQDELKRLKLELELAETRAKLEQEKRRVRMQVGCSYQFS